MVNPTNEMQETYAYLLDLEDLIFQKLIPGEVSVWFRINFAASYF